MNSKDQWYAFSVSSASFVSISLELHSRLLDAVPAVPTTRAPQISLESEQPAPESLPPSLLYSCNLSPLRPTSGQTSPYGFSLQSPSDPSYFDSPWSRAHAATAAPAAAPAPATPALPLVSAPKSCNVFDGLEGLPLVLYAHAEGQKTVVGTIEVVVTKSGRLRTSFPLGNIGSYQPESAVDVAIAGKRYYVYASTVLTPSPLQVLPPPRSLPALHVSVQPLAAGSMHRTAVALTVGPSEAQLPPGLVTRSLDLVLSSGWEVAKASSLRPVAGGEEGQNVVRMLEDTLYIPGKGFIGILERFPGIKQLWPKNTQLIPGASISFVLQKVGDVTRFSCLPHILMTLTSSTGTLLASSTFFIPCSPGEHSLTVPLLVPNHSVLDTLGVGAGDFAATSVPAFVPIHSFSEGSVGAVASSPGSLDVHVSCQMAGDSALGGRLLDLVNESDVVSTPVDRTPVDPESVLAKMKALRTMRQKSST